MNYIITHNCNKGCSYCFAKEKREKLENENAKDMDLDTFREILKKDPSSNVKLLGGEPTSHGQFGDFLKIIFEESRKDVTVISNFLFNEKTLNTIMNYTELFIKNKRQISFLVNSSELDEKNRMNTFFRNYSNVYSLMYHYDREGNVSCGITIEQDKSVNHYIEYLDFLFQNIKKIDRFRLSISFPGDSNSKKSNMYINDIETGNKLVVISKFLIDRAIKPNIDCIVFPCMFETKEHYKYMKNFVKSFGHVCSGIPADVFSNGELIYCYPLKDSIKTNIYNYERVSSAMDNISMKYNILNSNIEKPEECLSCKHYPKRCNGPCLGIIESEKINDMKLNFG